MTKGKLASTRSDHCAIIEAHGCGASIEELCERFNLKRPTIYRIIRNYEQSGLCLVVKPPPTTTKQTTSRASRTKLTNDQLLKMLYYFNSSSRSYGDVVKFIFATFGVTVSKTSVGYYLQRARNLLNESESNEAESINSSQFPEDDDQVHDSTLHESMESSSSPSTTSNMTAADVSPSVVTSFMEASMMTPEDTESELSYYFEF